MTSTSTRGEAAADPARQASGPTPARGAVWDRVDSYDSPGAEALLLAGEQRVSRPLRQRRELITQAVGAAGFLAAATALAVLAPWHRTLRATDVLILLVVWVIVERVKFPVAGGWTRPTMLVFVPMLFVLPTPVAPLFAMVGMLLRGLPEFVRRRAPVSRSLALIGDAWFSIGPALVIVLFGADAFAWSHWPVYVLALVAQIAFDLVATIGRCWIGEGISPRVQLPLLGWVYLVDVTLAPLGLVIASAAVIRPGIALIALSPAMMLIAFAHERKQRMNQALELSSAYRGTAMLLGDVVEANDYYTGTHSRDVVDLSLALADEVGLDGSQRRQLEFAALLHDIGKVRIPNEVINKPGPLDDDEWELVRRHTIEGERMLQQVGGILSNVGRIVRCTHERYDGRGYPDRLVGEEIPIESRIISVCDAYSAMTTDRPYRRAMLESEAIDELRRCAGSQFDPRLVIGIIAVLTR
jgi:HD-GYP domain-containing protein (c-di-GMP phosphodiesterase class II)